MGSSSAITSKIKIRASPLCRSFGQQTTSQLVLTAVEDEKRMQVAAVLSHRFRLLEGTFPLERSHAGAIPALITAEPVRRRCNRRGGGIADRVLHVA
jgi:hypothetical protein